MSAIVDSIANMTAPARRYLLVTDIPDGQERQISVDGLRLSVWSSGSGLPPVVFLSSLGGAQDEWDLLVPLLSGITTCITYGRPALGGSDPLPPDEAAAVRDPAWAADQLHALLQRAEIPHPYVLVTGSMGAFIGDAYAAAHPARTAGLILIDPTNLTPLPAALGGGPGVMVDNDDGGARFSKPTQARAGTVGPRVRAIVVSASADNWQRIPPPEHDWGSFTLADMDRVWQSRQNEWARELDAAHIVADRADHLVYRDQPALVAFAVTAMVQAARDGRPVQLDPQAVRTAGGSLVPLESADPSAGGSG